MFSKCVLITHHSNELSSQHSNDMKLSKIVTEQGKYSTKSISIISVISEKTFSNLAELNETERNITQNIATKWPLRNFRERWVRNGSLRIGYANEPFDFTPTRTAFIPISTIYQQDNVTYKNTNAKAKSRTREERVLDEHEGKHRSTQRKKWLQHYEDPKLARDETNRLKRRRTKRGVVQLYNMVSCATGCDPLIYKGYGCYCGFLGSGYPVDGIDKCCKMHDICYDVANCPMYLEYVVPYYWKCYRGKSLCAIDQLDLGGSGSCAQRLCECDRLLAECLSRFPCPRRRAKCVSSPWRLLQNTLMFF